MRLAIALQQQENDVAMSAAKARQDEQKRTNALRTGRSAAYRPSKTKNPAASIPIDYSLGGSMGSNYVAPGTEGGLNQESEDYKLAVELQKVEASSVGTEKLTKELTENEQKEKDAQVNRSARTGHMRGF